MMILVIIFGCILLIPVVASFMVIIALLGWTFGILVDAALAILVIFLLFKVLDELF